MRPPSEAGSPIAGLVAASAATPRRPGARRRARVARVSLIGALGLSTLAAAAGAAGCRDGASGTSDASAAALMEASVAVAPKAPAPSASASPSAPVASAHPTSPSDGGPLAVCRVMASEGGPPASADATTWLDVPAKANFTVRTLESGRELRFEGAGRVRPCGSDVALVAAGSALGLPGSGEAPGAEQWVATACGAARWASGVHRFGATREACMLQSSLGSVQLWLADDVTADEAPLDAGPAGASAAAPAAAAPSAASPARALLDDAGRALLGDAGRDGDGSPWRRIDARRALRLRPRGPLDGPAAVKSALAACEAAAAQVEGLAKSMLGGDAAPGDVGALAARSVVARGSARAACAVAAVRLSLSAPKADDQARLDAADSRWRAPQAR